MSGPKDTTARKNEQILMELLKDDANKHCADCGQKGTRWASWNLGVFLCIRCGGLHRKLGTHISKVKSVNLDKWTDDQVQGMLEKGNAKVNGVYNPHPSRFPFPAYSGDMEQYIRDKYERKLFMAPDARGTTPPTSSRSSLASSSHPTPGTERYSLQMRSLREMGFADVTANSAAVNAAKGNLQEAIEALLAGTTSKLSLSDKGRRSSQPEAKPPLSSPADDLADIFGTSSAANQLKLPANDGTSCRSLPTTTAASSSLQNTSILDLDLPSPHEHSRNKEEEVGTNVVVSDEFEEFERAPEPASKADFSTQPVKSFARRPSLGEAQVDFKPNIKTLPSVAPDLSNPWASNHVSNGDAFDDIDPFRGFTPTRGH